MAVARISVGVNSGNFVPFSGANKPVDLNTQKLYVTDIRSDATSTPSMFLSGGGFTSILRITSEGLFSYGAAGNANDSTAFGSFCMNLATATANTGYGRAAMYLNVTSPQNCAFGTNALFSLASGTGQNNAFGKNAGSGLTTGSFNNIFGYFAGSSLTTNTDCTLMGDSAARSAVVDGITAVGSQVFHNLLSGGNNTAIGVNTAYTFTNSDANTIIGAESAIGVTTGRANTMIGCGLGNVSNLPATLSNAILITDGDGQLNGPKVWAYGTTTGSTASTEKVGYKVFGMSTQFATGALALQRSNYLSAATYSFVGASVITDAIGLDVDSPIAGTNATITNNYAIRSNGNIRLLGNLVTDTTTGIKIGTSTSQKLSFYNKTPIIQPSNSITGSIYVLVGGSPVSTNDTFGGYTLQQLAAIIINLGLAA